jgi:hypothetical protein
MMNAQGNTYMGKKVAPRLTTINKADVTPGYDKSVKDFGGEEEVDRPQLRKCGDFLNVQI